MPLPIELESLDPCLEEVTEKAEASANVFETLTRVAAGAQAGPWLAQRWRVTGRGRRYLFLLRSNLRFHDGRRLTARDVRATFERVLRSPLRRPAHLLLPLRGATAYRAGAADEVAGIEVISERQIALELERPLAFFLRLLTHPGLAIVPETVGAPESVTGQELTTVQAQGDIPRGSWRDGCAGTGPFRVVYHDSGRLELERHPDYWRCAYPRCQSLVFHLGYDPEHVARDFESGILTLGSHLRPGDLELLRRRPEWRRGYHESPRLVTYFLALATRHGPLADPSLRQALCAALDFDRLLEGLSLSRASGLFPPGLLGHEADRPLISGRGERRSELAGLRLRAFIHPEMSDRYGFSVARLADVLDATGIELEEVEGEISEIFLGPRPPVDLALLRWGADYPDTDGFAQTLLHSREGYLAGFCGAPEIDHWIEEGRRETDPSLRHAFYCQIEESLAREHRLLPLCYGHTHRLCQPAVRGLDFNLIAPEVRYDELFLEP